MKTLRNTLLFLLLSAGYTYAQNIIVQGEKKLNIDLAKYKTFGWMDSDKQNPHLIEYRYDEVYPVTEQKRVKGKTDVRSHQKEVVVYSYSYVVPSSDSTINRTILQATKAELEGRGYKKDDVNPDLLIAYRIYDSSTKIKGYNTEPTVLSDGSEIRQPKDTVSYTLKPGSIMISLIDTKTSDVVWEGFASGITKGNGTINDKAKIKEAINLIFKKYEWRGDKYSMN
ncbi:MAG TPA: DUF4136 domain-containing protein [Cyclobacteriaceae bacterium]|nr:DUF4136 domain-containing protein [Cyclobacteriaceae bacterium]